MFTFPFLIFPVQLHMEVASYDTLKTFILICIKKKATKKN